MDVNTVKGKTISTLLAILSIFAFLPGLAVIPVHAQSPTVAVDPAVNARDVGQSFTVMVTVTDVMALVGYDVSLTYNNVALMATSANFDGIGTLFNGMPHFNVPGANYISNPTGTVRTASVLLSGATVDVFSPTPVMIVSFTVIAAQDSVLDLIDTELVQLDLSGGLNTIIPALSPGAFFVPPNVIFDLVTMTFGSIEAQTVAPSNRQRFLSKGELDVSLNGFIQLDPAALRAAFGGVHFTLVGPGCSPTCEGDSDIAFMFPGQTAVVHGTVGYDAATGNYLILVTVLRCAGPDLASCVLGDSTSGKFFKVHF